MYNLQYQLKKSSKNTNTKKNDNEEKNEEKKGQIHEIKKCQVGIPEKRKLKIYNKQIMFSIYFIEEDIFRFKDPTGIQAK